MRNVELQARVSSRYAAVMLRGELDTADAVAGAVAAQVADGPAPDHRPGT